MIDYAEFKENMKNHKKLWTMISELPILDYERNCNIGVLKERVIKRNRMPIPEIGFCYLCNIVYADMSSDVKICGKCPCTVNKKPDGFDDCLNGKYMNACRLFKKGDYEAFRKIAKEIAELPIVNPIYAEYADRMKHENE